MARDYSSRKSKRKGRAAARRKSESLLPAWVWAFAGLTAGLLVAVVVYIVSQEPGDAIEIAGVPVADGGDGEAGESEELPPKEEARFSFYEMLPNYEIVVPDRKQAEGAQEKQGEEPATEPQVEEPGKYIIQAGSFQTREDAEKRKAEMALLGIETQIEKVTIDNDKIWYRVRTPPQADLATVNNNLKLLEENGIDSLLIRFKG